MTRRVIAICVVFFVMLPGFGAALTPTVAGQTESARIMRVNWGGIPDTLDPHLSYMGQWAMSGSISKA